MTFHLNIDESDASFRFLAEENNKSEWIWKIYMKLIIVSIATESYGQMTRCLFESNWQNLSLRLRKYMILMIGKTQRPLYYSGFGLLPLDLGTFSGVTFNS